jgi:hypothetical protein
MIYFHELCALVLFLSNCDVELRHKILFLYGSLLFLIFILDSSSATNAMNCIMNMS